MNASRAGLSFATVLTLVGRTYRSVRYSGGGRADAEQAALDAYCSLHPDAPEGEARETVAAIVKASSEAGLICTGIW